ncbi:hypothetical protein ABGF49_00910 [Helcococcus ovis]|uniref:hypothetical protein n=1 Tax=Helcococcus TaxID=31983 RepID=UPI00106FE1B0|nr:hypothetical protein [Helcococcus ovis]WNZ00479.1 hypothetical protein EQF90_004270 [Helcococcus ovis]
MKFNNKQKWILSLFTFGFILILISPYEKYKIITIFMGLCILIIAFIMYSKNKRIKDNENEKKNKK